MDRYTSTNNGGPSHAGQTAKPSKNKDTTLALTETGRLRDSASAGGGGGGEDPHERQLKEIRAHKLDVEMLPTRSVGKTGGVQKEVKPKPSSDYHNMLMPNAPVKEKARRHQRPCGTVVTN